jgi:hypothetical protein
MVVGWSGMGISGSINAEVAAVSRRVRFSFTCHSRKTELRKLLTVSLIVLAAVTVWAATQGMTPFGWLKHIMEVSRGDKANASPLLGGEWSFGFALQNLITPIVVLALLPFVSLKEAKNKVAFITVAGSALLTLILISRPFNYGIFWILLFIPVLFIGSRRKLTYAMLGTLLSFYVGIRLIKTTEVISSWKSRNPEIVQGFVREHIPPGSIVYGSGSYFYYAVEHSKSSYRFPVEMTTPGLLSKAETAQNFEPDTFYGLTMSLCRKQFKVEPLARYEPKDETVYIQAFKPLRWWLSGVHALPSVSQSHATRIVESQSDLHDVLKAHSLATHVLP